MRNGWCTRNHMLPGNTQSKTMAAYIPQTKGENNTPVLEKWPLCLFRVALSLAWLDLRLPYFLGASNAELANFERYQKVTRIESAP